MTDDIGYQALTQAAMRGVMKEALKVAESPNGLPGDHHFYITFRTKAPGVKLAEALVQKFPDEMTIVIQHQYWDLEVHERHFELVLQFSGIPQHLHIPYSAVNRFVDPSVNFGLGFEEVDAEEHDPLDKRRPGDADLAATSRPASDGIQPDAFREITRRAEPSHPFDMLARFRN